MAIGTKGAIRFDGEDQNAVWLYKAEGPEATRGFVKILTDPFHDIKLYHRAPLLVLRGELVEPAPAHGSHGLHVMDAIETNSSP